MQVTGRFSSFVGKFVSSLKRKHKSPLNAYSSFYEHGFMANEIEALQSIFRTQDAQHPNKRK